MQIAREMIGAEMSIVIEEKGPVNSLSFSAVLDEIHKAEVYIPTRGPDGSFGVPANKGIWIIQIQSRFSVDFDVLCVCLFYF